jgi:hypothetical protein
MSAITRIIWRRRRFTTLTGHDHLEVSILRDEGR